MPAPKAPVVGSSKTVSLEEGVFGAEVKPHLVHETVRAEQNAARANTRGGQRRPTRASRRDRRGRVPPRAGTIRAPHFTGGGMAFPPNNRNFDSKVNRKARKAALRSALSAHAQGET